MKANYSYLRLVICMALSLSYMSCSNLIDKEKMKQEIITELQKKPVVVKGDGDVYYAEPVVIGTDEYYIHHSTLKCPNIKLGAVNRNVYYTNQYHNLYCTTCMDDKLIMHFKESFLSSK